MTRAFDQQFVTKTSTFTYLSFFGFRRFLLQIYQKHDGFYKNLIQITKFLSKNGTFLKSVFTDNIFKKKYLNNCVF